MSEIELDEKAAHALSVAEIDESWIELHTDNLRAGDRLRRVCWASATVIGLCIIATGVSIYKTDKLQTWNNLKAIKITALELERAALAEQLRPVGVDVILVGVLNQVDPARLDGRGRNHIAVAMRKGDIGLAEYWEGRGVSWNQPAWFGRQDGGEWVQSFDDDGGSRVGVSPLMIAARRGHYQVIRYMLHPDRRDKIDWGFTRYGGQSIAGVLSEHIILYPQNLQLPLILANVEAAVAQQVEF